MCRLAFDRADFWPPYGCGLASGLVAGLASQQTFRNSSQEWLSPCRLLPCGVYGVGVAGFVAGFVCGCEVVAAPEQLGMGGPRFDVVGLEAAAVGMLKAVVDGAPAEVARGLA